MPLEDLDGRGLAGAVRAEQGEDLAAGDLEVDAADRGDVPVALAQVPSGGLCRCHGDASAVDLKAAYSLSGSGDGGSGTSLRAEKKKK